ncbi:MAG: glycoside hydrolase family 88 protein [Candidatus Omnitrophica bacterium]|nr:glycoside hydrolase family 88 protein [Candidatus Omnitrophota bacterium]
MLSNDAITMAKKWVMDSGIQNDKGYNRGGFNSWFDLETEEYPYVYSEITGYGITTLLFLHRFFTGNFVERSVLAADWLLVNALHECGGVKTRQYQHDMEESESYSFESGNIYAFDNGMVLYGLVNLYKECGEKKYLEFAKKIADFLIRTMQKEDGLFYASYNPETEEKEDVFLKWSSQSGSYHAKLALGFTDLFDVTKDDVYKDAVMKLCYASLKFQDSNGRFITSHEDESTHLHPHAYSAEGLLYAGIYFGNEEFILSAEKAVVWALNNQRQDGGIPKKYNNGNFVELYRTDILSQILRLALVLQKLGRLDKKYVQSIKKLREKLITFQYSGDDSQSGGFYYGFTLDGAKKKHINSWCSMFALQALILYESQGVKESKSQRVRESGSRESDLTNEFQKT